MVEKNHKIAGRTGRKDVEGERKFIANAVANELFRKAIFGEKEMAEDQWIERDEEEPEMDVEDLYLYMRANLQAHTEVMNEIEKELTKIKEVMEELKKCVP